VSGKFDYDNNRHVWSHRLWISSMWRWVLLGTITVSSPRVLGRCSWLSLPSGCGRAARSLSGWGKYRHRRLGKIRVANVGVEGPSWPRPGARRTASEMQPRPGAVAGDAATAAAIAWSNWSDRDSTAAEPAWSTDADKIRRSMDDRRGGAPGFDERRTWLEHGGGGKRAEALMEMVSTEAEENEWSGERGVGR
jgi:hypothetical protein